MTVLITAAELAEALESPRPPVVLDVRWRLTVAGGAAYDGLADYRAGHIPTAVYVDLDTELARHGEPTDGRHPLPSIADLQASARRWGINDGDSVVVYDGAGNLAAARAWWLLKWGGVADVRLLDGALLAWDGAGFGLDRLDHPEVDRRGDVTLTEGNMATLGLAQVPHFAGQLVDARAAERYRGETEPIDPKAGHIPGAVNAPTTENLNDDGTFRTADELKARFRDAGITGEAPVAAYCGSGVTAAHEVAALAIAGIDAALYPGSWSQWSNHDLPVATA
ncbi:sulfurtransferase [Nocardioides montaniterrae]